VTFSVDIIDENWFKLQNYVQFSYSWRFDSYILVHVDIGIS